jgi:signal transduction histidine kinase
VAATHVDPAKATLLWELRHRYPLTPNGLQPGSHALRSGQTALYPEMEELPTIAQDAEHLHLLQELAPVSAMAVPLKAQGDTIGVMTLASTRQERRFDRAAIKLAEELASRAAIAVEHAWLYREARQAERESRRHAARVSALAEASRTFAETSRDVETLLQTAARQVAEEIGDYCGILLLSEDGQWLRPAAISHRHPEGRAILQEMLTAADQGSAEGINGKVVQTGQPILIPVVNPAELRAEIKPEYTPYLERLGMQSLVVVPLQVQGRILGTLPSMRSRPDAPYTLEDQTFLQELADRIALAIENTRIYQKLTEREQQLQELVGKLLVAHEEERRRVAYEVHDELAQVAASAHQHLQAFASQHRPRSREAREQLNRTVELAQHTIREARRIVANLWPTVLDDFGLVAAIRAQVKELQAAGWEVDWQENLGVERLSSVVETSVFRVVQEALRNVQKHTDISRVRIRLDRQADAIRLEIRDWGQRFDPKGITTGGAGERVGLASMQERITLLGGQFAVESERGAGTRVVATVPVAGPKSTLLRPPNEQPDAGY